MQNHNLVSRWWGFGLTLVVALAAPPVAVSDSQTSLRMPWDQGGPATPGAPVGDLAAPAMNPAGMWRLTGRQENVPRSDWEAQLVLFPNGVLFWIQTKGANAGAARTGQWSFDGSTLTMNYEAPVVGQAEWQSSQVADAVMSGRYQTPQAGPQPVGWGGAWRAELIAKHDASLDLPGLWKMEGRQANVPRSGWKADLTLTGAGSLQWRETEGANVGATRQGFWFYGGGVFYMWYKAPNVGWVPWDSQGGAAVAARMSGRYQTPQAGPQPIGWGGQWTAVKSAGPPPASAGQPDLSIVYLVDTSGSMRGRKIQEAREAVKESVKLSDDGRTEWALIRFDACHAVVTCQFTMDGSKVQAAAARLRDGGDTPLSYAIAVATEYLVTEGRAPVGRLIVMADGQENCGGPGACRRALPQDEAVDALRPMFIQQMDVPMQPGLSGTVHHYVPEPGASVPRRAPLQGALVLVGQGFNYRGPMEVAGHRLEYRSIAAEVRTNEEGKFVARVPQGSYAVIFWKEGYAPVTGTWQSPAANLAIDLGKGQTGHGLQLQRIQVEGPR